ncbi:MAG TPA: FecR domain-containing protein [Bryobacteraceae bacterium]|jgi:hypothetical protein|nr:FecR domain-containing protein [Bryobacteraceae bacterium]
MNDDYLWDRSGTPDPEIAHLEQALAPLRWSRTNKRCGHLLAIAALILLAAGVSFLWSRKMVATPWQLVANDRPQHIRTGQWIETPPHRAAVVRSDAIGTLEIEPGSRLQLLDSGKDKQRFSLARGTIHALIWAPPATFVVDTPAAKTVDLGCEYTLHVDNDGTGLITVEMGWVAFAWQSVESFIPAGASCTTRPGHGPGTPFFNDASPAFKTALAQFDNDHSAESLQSLLAAARSRDAMSLWHLLQRTSGEDRAQAFSRYAQLVALPPVATRDAILRGDPKALDAAWNALDLGDTAWWREWKRSW